MPTPLSPFFPAPVPTASPCRLRHTCHPQSDIRPLSDITIALLLLKLFLSDAALCLVLCKHYLSILPLDVSVTQRRIDSRGLSAPTCVCEGAGKASHLDGALLRAGFCSAVRRNANAVLL